MAGASYDIVVLSSSPPDTRHVPQALSPASLERRVGIPSSPLRAMSPPRRRASPSSRASASRMGSRAQPVPLGVERGFATARSLLADININDRGLGAIEAALESTRAPTGPENTIKASKPTRKRAPKAAITGAGAEEPKAKPKSRGRKPKNASIGGTHDDAPNRRATATTSSYFAQTAAADAAAPAPKSRKPRVTKKAGDTADDTEIQTTIRKTRVTKPRSTTRTTKKAQGKAAEVASAHFRSRDTDSAPARSEAQSGDASIWDVPLSPNSRSNGPPKHRPPDSREPLELDEAVSRRRDWTPPPDTERQEILTSSVGKENQPGPAKEVFTKLLSEYAYANLENALEPGLPISTSSRPAGTMKRRRAEPIDLPSNQAVPQQVSPEKGKAPKKKPRTITDLVTGQYAPQQAPESPEVTSNFFTRPATTLTTTSKVPLNDTADIYPDRAAKKPARKRSTSKTGSEASEGKTKPKKASKKAANKPKPVAEKLLSPSSALVRMNRQDVMFGTSSQLAREESPTILRAIRDSEQDEDLRHRYAPDSAPAVAPWSRLQRIEGRRALWKASSRDDAGQMLGKESVYLPEPDRTQDIPLVIGGVLEKPEDSFLDIDDFAQPPPAPVLISSDLPSPPPTVPDDTVAANEGRSTSSPPYRDIDDFLRDTPRTLDAESLPYERKTIEGSTFKDIDDFLPAPPPSNQHADSSFIDIDDFPPSAQPIATNSLAKSTASPKKRRGRPPKSQSAFSLQAAASAQASKVTSPSTPRRNKTRFHSIDAILDSEDDEALSPTPPRTRLFADSPSLSLAYNSPSATTTAKDTNSELVPIYRISEIMLTFEGVRPTLFSSLTSLIRSLPPSQDPLNPSWHEKILMYDAIFAEDFTAFLNTHDRIRTYKRATQKQVKARNKELKAQGEEEMKVEEGDGMVLAVEKEVEAWMVQKWCEEMSVCCVFREKKNGGARKGLY